MQYFGIKTPGKDSYIWWIANCEHNAWMSFFQYPSKDDKIAMHRLPLCEAILAYEAIGYRCVELKIEEIREILYTGREQIHVRY